MFLILKQKKDIYFLPVPQSKVLIANFLQKLKNFLRILFLSISYIAECSGLTSICGMGYRKALEFLIKDYAIHKNSQANERDKIIQSPLMNCIKNYIQDERLVALAKASTWLGNDETHYIKKHPSYTLSNLKTFINAFLTFIDADLAYEDAQELLDS